MVSAAWAERKGRVYWGLGKFAGRRPAPEKGLGPFYPIGLQRVRGRALRSNHSPRRRLTKEAMPTCRSRFNRSAAKIASTLAIERSTSVFTTT